MPERGRRSRRGPQDKAGPTTPAPQAEPTTGAGPEGEPTRPTELEAEPTTQGEPPRQHDRTGLDLARAVAAALRGSTAKRPSRQPRSSRRSVSTELSGAHPDGRDPTRVAAAVDRLIAESGWTTDVAVHGVFGRWPTIVGTDVAAHCTPETFQDGHLRVRTDSTAWATQLRLLAPTVVRRLNEELGHGTVLRIDVAGPDTPSWRKGPRAVRDGRGPRDTYG